MNKKQVKKICAKLKCTALVETYIYEDGSEKTEVNFYGAEIKDIIKNKIDLSLPNMKKSFYSSTGRVALVGKDVYFGGVQQCKKVGVTKKVIPEHIEETPIWRCH